MHRELTERQILCDFRPDSGIRLGPHYFTSDDELGETVAAIEDILSMAPTAGTWGVARH